MHPPLTATASPRRRLLLRVAAAASALPALWPGVARAAYELRPWPAGKAAPALALPDLDGKVWRLAALQRRVVLLNFWATWCEPCRAELPSLRALQDRHAADGLLVLTVNYQESAATVRRFLASAPSPLPVLLDADGQAAKAWTPRVFPTTVAIDRSGRPRHVVVGEADWDGDAAREWLRPLLEPRRSA
jgi:thiol-disulfide isomerase/thioredoxin